MNTLGKTITLILSILGVGVIVALVAVTGLGAIGRYSHMGGVSWSFELVGMLFVWATAIGTILAEIAGENVSIDGNSVTSARGRVFRVYHNLILLIVASAFLWSGFAMLRRTGFTPTPVLRVPSFTVQSSMMVLGAGLAIIAIIRILKAFR